MTKKITAVFFIIPIFYCSYCKAQSFISFSTGLSYDLQNHPTFYHVPLTSQFKPFKNNSLIFEVSYEFPISRKFKANAYTLDPSLPGEITLNDKVAPSLFTVGVGFQIPLYNRNKNPGLYLILIPFAICSENLKVQHGNYDKEKYDILNPNVTRSVTSIAPSASLVFRFGKKEDNMLVQLHVQTVPITQNQDYATYTLPYKKIAPLKLMFGYTLKH